MKEGETMSNTFYTAFKVLKNFAEAEKGYTINNFGFPDNCITNCMIWVDDNPDSVTRLFCKQLTPTTFIIIGFDGLYNMVYITAKDYTDVNTPPVMGTIN